MSIGRRVGFGGDARDRREYGSLATLAYELDKPIGTSFGDVEFYLSRLQGVNRPVLEPAVGTGRILIPLLEQGFSVRGYDNSPAMLDQCRANCARHDLVPDVVEGDMTRYCDERRYEAIVIPTGSFALLPDGDSTLAALEAMHGNLASRGRLIVDIEPPTVHVEPDRDPVRHWWHEGSLITLDTWKRTADPIAQRSTSWLRYERWDAGVLTRTELQMFSLLWFGLAEFTTMLYQAGFGEVAVHGGYRPGSAPTPPTRCGPSKPSAAETTRLGSVRWYRSHAATVLRRRGGPRGSVASALHNSQSCQGRTTSRGDRGAHERTGRTAIRRRRPLHYETDRYCIG